MDQSFPKAVGPLGGNPGSVGHFRLKHGTDVTARLAAVCYSAYLHRDLALYSEPDRFDPNRWLPEHADRERYHEHGESAAGA